MARMRKHHWNLGSHLSVRTLHMISKNRTCPSILRIKPDNHHLDIVILELPLVQHQGVIYINCSSWINIVRFNKMRRLLESVGLHNKMYAYTNTGHITTKRLEIRECNFRCHDGKK